MDNTVGPDLPLSMGVFMISLGGHAALPKVYREMSKPDEFNSMLDVCFLIMFIIYTTTGVVGYLIYGAASNIIITTNLIQNPGGILPKIAAGFIISKNYLALSPIVAVLCNISEVMMGIEDARLTQRIYRSFVFLGASGLSYLASDALPFLESFTGAFGTMLTSFILPPILFAVSSNNLAVWKIRLACAFIALFGFAMMGLLMYGAITSLIHPDRIYSPFLLTSWFCTICL